MYNDNLAYTENNWSNIEENENIIHSDIDEVVNEFYKVKIIGNMSYVSDYENNIYIKKPKLSTHDIFQNIADVGGFLEERGNLRTQETQLSVFEIIL